MSKKKFYFAVADGCYDPETGATDEAGMSVAADEFETPEAVVAFVEQQNSLFSRTAPPDHRG